MERVVSSSWLEEIDKRVTGSGVIDFLCGKALVKSKLRNKTEQPKAADSILVMTCGVGAQAVAASVNRVCHPACDTILSGNTTTEIGWEKKVPAILDAAGL